MCALNYLAPKTIEEACSLVLCYQGQAKIIAGGIIGVIMVWVVSYLVSSTGLMTTVVSADIVILAVSVSVGIGLFFGFYPAWHASHLNPIDALRSE